MSWFEIKEALIELLKFALLTILMTIGFWTVYGMLWLAFGLPETSWYLWALFGLAVLSEYCYCGWLNS